MKPPYYIVTAICRTKACTTTYFSKNRKAVDKTSASGSAYRISRLVCEKCGMWADVTEIEEVK